MAALTAIFVVAAPTGSGKTGVLELHWSLLASDNWMANFAAMPPVMLEYECRVLPAEELRQRARKVRLSALAVLEAEARDAAEEIRENIEEYKGPLQELREQMYLIETHIQEQEAEAADAEARATAFEAERSRLLMDQVADSQQNTESEGGMEQIPEEAEAE